MDKWLRNTTVVRIIALMLGILLWAVVHLDEQTTTGGNTPQIFKTTEINNIGITKVGLDDTQYSIKSVQPSMAKVKLRGKDVDLKRIDPRDTRVLLDLSTVTKGTHILPLQEDGFPAGVDVEIFPKSVTVTVEEKVKKEMPVNIDVVGTPGNGFKAGLPIINPNRIHITAPTSRLDEVASVRGEVNVEGVESAVSKEVRLVAYNNDGEEMQVAITPSVVDVEVPITSPFKRMPLQIRLIGQTPPGYSVAAYKQSVNQVTVYGPQDVLDNMEFYEGRQIDLSELTADKLFSLDIPLKIGVEQIDPKKVDVELDIVPSEIKTLQQVKITLNGLNDEYTTRIVSPGEGIIDLTLEAAPSIMEKLKPEDVQAGVDVSNLPTGTHELPLVLNLPPYVKQGSPDDIMITVQISDKAVPATTPPPITGEETSDGETEQIEAKEPAAARETTAPAAPVPLAANEKAPVRGNE